MRGWLLLIASLCLITAVFFWRYFFWGELPVTSGDPAILYHFHALAAGWLKQGVISFWQPEKLLGTNLFSSDISLSPFHLASLFLALAPDYPTGQVMFVGVQMLVWILGTYFYLHRDLKIRPILSFFPGVLLIFTPSFRNEYFFNTFGWMCLLPLLLMLTNRFHRTGRFVYSSGVVLVLLLMFHAANLAAVQFSLIFLGVYSIWIKVSDIEMLISWKRGVIHYCLVVFLFLGSVAYYIYPMWLESLRGERSHIYSIFNWIHPNAWLKSFLFPFTSWIFIDEKMLTSGFLTSLESLNIYLNVLLLPVFFLFFYSRKRFKSEERFYFYFLLGFIFLSILNGYVPILSLLVRFTKGTGWHRSLPLFFFSGCVALSLCFNHYCENKDGGSESQLRKYALMCYHIIWRMLVGIYAVASGGVLLGWMLWKTGEQEIILMMLDFFTPRPVEHIAFYLNHFFSPIRGAMLLSVPVFILLSLLLLERLRSRGMNPAGKGYRIALALPVVVVAGQFALSELYYPFNKGVLKPQTFKETTFLKQLPLFSRIGIVFNSFESYVLRQSGMENDVHNPRLHLLMAEYPEMGRLQSDATMDGSFFNTLGLQVYNRGVHFPGRRLNRFHEALIQENSLFSKIFKKKKGYLRLGPKEASSSLLARVGVNYILSSLPLSHENIKLIFRGDAYYIYRIKRAVPRFVLVNQIRRIKDGVGALNVIQSSNFEPSLEAVVETSLVLPEKREGSGKEKITLTSFQPNSVELNVNAPSGGFLVFNDSYHPGWRAWINGEETKIYRANYVVKGILLPSGKCHVKFLFMSPGFREGLFVTFLACLALCAIWMVTVIQYRNRKRISPSNQ